MRGLEVKLMDLELEQGLIKEITMFNGLGKVVAVNERNGINGVLTEYYENENGLYARVAPVIKTIDTDYNIMDIRFEAESEIGLVFGIDFYAPNTAHGHKVIYHAENGLARVMMDQLGNGAMKNSKMLKHSFGKNQLYKLDHEGFDAMSVRRLDNGYMSVSLAGVSSRFAVKVTFPNPKY